MSVSIGRIREFERDGLRAIAHKVARSLVEQRAGKLVADQPRQEVVQDHPLIVPARDAPRLLEEPVLRRTTRPQPIDRGVVQLEHHHVQLGDKEVGVVTGIADERHPLRVAGQIVRPSRVLLPRTILAASVRS